MLKILNWIACFVSAIGAMNWGFVAFFNLNLISYLNNLYPRQDLSKFIYGFIALCGLYTLILVFSF